MAKEFLAARWTNLIIASYRVSPERLKDRVPPGLELDLRDGNAHVSLVAFQFTHTRVKGIAWPGYSHFNEVNLRFYVRAGERRGVVFIREYVPKRLIAWVARTFYNEPYRIAEIEDNIVNAPEEMIARYRMFLGNHAMEVEVVANPKANFPSDESEEHFFKEHQWGYGVSRNGVLQTYEVRHPLWRTFEVRSYRIDWDWELAYGKDWAFLQKNEPCSVILAAGSEVSVSPLLKR